MGKGDTPRPVNKKRYDTNYDRVFGKRTIKTWTEAPNFAEGDGCEQARPEVERKETETTTGGTNHTSSADTSHSIVEGERDC